jgi:hypothetical protein
MDQATTSAPADRQVQAAKASVDAGMRDVAALYPEAMRPALWAFENTRVLFDLQRTLLDIGLDVMRQQQGALFEAALRGMRSSMEPDRTSMEDALQNAFMGFARIGFEAFERMATVMSAAEDAARQATSREAEIRQS